MSCFKIKIHPILTETLNEMIIAKKYKDALFCIHLLLLERKHYKDEEIDDVLKKFKTILNEVNSDLNQ